LFSFLSGPKKIYSETHHLDPTGLGSGFRELIQWIRI